MSQRVTVSEAQDQLLETTFELYRIIQRLHQQYEGLRVPYEIAMDYYEVGRALGATLLGCSGCHPPRPPSSATASATASATRDSLVSTFATGRGLLHRSARLRHAPPSSAGEARQEGLPQGDVGPSTPPAQPDSGPRPRPRRRVCENVHSVHFREIDDQNLRHRFETPLAEALRSAEAGESVVIAGAGADAGRAPRVPRYMAGVASLTPARPVSAAATRSNRRLRGCSRIWRRSASAVPANARPT